MSKQEQNIQIVISVRNIDQKYTFPHYFGTYCIFHSQMKLDKYSKDLPERLNEVKIKVLCQSPSISEIEISNHNYSHIVI